MTCTLNLPQGENSLWEPWAVSKGNNAEFWKENLQTIAFLPSRPSHFFFFSFAMLFIDILSPPSCLLSLQDKRAFCTCMFTLPTISWALCGHFYMSLHYRMACQATGGGGTLAISAGWSLMFLLVDICKAFLWNPYLPNVPPFSAPDTFCALQPKGFLLLGVSLCVLLPRSRGRL